MKTGFFKVPLSRHMNIFECNIEKSQKGDSLTLSVLNGSGKKIYIHSKIDPAKESNTYREQILNITTETLFILGAGLGYFMEPLAYNHNVKKIILIDPLQGISEQRRQIPQFTNGIADKNVIIIDDSSVENIENVLIKIIQNTPIQSYSILEHISSARSFPAFFESVHETINRVIRKSVGNKATIRQFSSLFAKNCIKNIRHIDRYTPFSFLTGTFKTTALIVSTAPSIDVYIEAIRMIAHTIFIIAVDSAYPVLQRNGIRPDLLVTTDPQPWTEEHMLNFDYTIPVLSTLSSSYSPHKDGRTFLFLNSHPFSQLIHELRPDLKIHETTGSVAGDAVNAAMQMGFTKIIIGGTDFSFPSRMIYSCGSAYVSRYGSIFNNRLLTADTLTEKYIRRGGKPRNYNGLLSRESFIQFKDSFTRLISSQNKSEIIHLFSGGLSLEGCKTIDSPAELVHFIDPMQRKESLPANLLTFKNESLFMIELNSILLNDSVLREIFLESFSRNESHAGIKRCRNLLHSLLRSKK